MQIQMRVSKLLLFMLPALAFGVLEKPMFAQTSRKITDYKSLGDAKESYRGALLVLAFELKPIPPAERLAHFYNLKLRFYERMGKNEIAGFDSSLQPNGAYSDPNTAILVNPLVEKGSYAFTPDGINLYCFIRLLTQADKIIGELNQVFPVATEFPSGRSAVMDSASQAWVQQWLKKADAKQLKETDDKGMAFVRSLQSLNIEERSQALRNAANAASPEAGKAFAQYYDPKKVRIFADSRNVKLSKIQQPKKAIPNPLAIPEFSQNIFDPTIENLPINFVGNDVNTIINALKNNAIKPKDEFEKTADFTNRLNKSVSEILGLQGEWTDRSRFSVIWDIDKENRKEYNSDSETLKIGSSEISKRIPFFIETYQKSIPFILLRISEENIRQFPHIESKVYDENDVLLYSVTLKDFIYKMSPEVAKEEKPFFNMLIVFRLASNSYENSNGGYAVSANVSELWFFNSQTGRVYNKIIAEK